MVIEETYRASFDSEWPLDEWKAVVGQVQRAVVVAHTNADGDAVGSVCGISRWLHAVGVPQVQMMLPDGCPDDMAWLPATDQILHAQQQATLCHEAIRQADLVVAVDVSSFGRTGSLEPWLLESQAVKVLVDHHENPTREQFDLIFSEPHVSSACEMVFWLMYRSFGESHLDTTTATYLYTGICTDTGTFAYSNNRPSLYLATAHLLAHGIDPMAINRKIRNVFTTRRLQFFAFAISQRLRVYEEQGIALMTLTADDMRQHQVASHELTGLVNEVMRLRDVDCAVLVREEADKVRLSLRSKERVDVNRLAADMFGGGGHQRAAGATSLLPLEATLEIVKRTLGLES